MSELQVMIDSAVKSYDIADAAIAAMGAAYMQLSIAGQDDKEGYSAVREARITVKGKRVEVEKKRKELKEDSLRFGKAVDAEAKRITGLLEPIELHLSKQEDDYDAEKERVKQQVIRKEQERMQARADKLHEYGGSVNIVSLGAMTDDEFTLLLDTVKIEYEAEQARQAELDRIRQEELKRIADVATEQARERKRLEDERLAAEGAIRLEREKLDSEVRKIEAEKQKIEDSRIAAENEKNRLAEIEEAKNVAAENARREAILEADRAELERKREAALRPDIEKLQAWGREIGALIGHRPAVKDPKMEAISVRVEELLIRAMRVITLNVKADA